MAITFPQEIIDAIIDELNDRTALLACCTVSQSFLPRARARFWFHVPISYGAINHLQHHPSLFSLVRSAVFPPNTHDAAVESPDFVAKLGEHLEHLYVEHKGGVPLPPSFFPAFSAYQHVRCLYLQGVHPNYVEPICTLTRHLPLLKDLCLSEYELGFPYHLGPSGEHCANCSFPELDHLGLSLANPRTRLQHALIGGHCTCSLSQVRSTELTLRVPLVEPSLLLEMYRNLEMLTEFTMRGIANGTVFNTVMKASLNK